MSPEQIGEISHIEQQKDEEDEPSRLYQEEI